MKNTEKVTNEKDKQYENFYIEITGNTRNKSGNPIPYTRTLSHAWRGDAIRYHEWQQLVRAEFVKRYPRRARYDFKKGNLKTPLDTGSRQIKANCEITYKDKTHGDADNIIKGMLDALLENDKYVMEIHVYAKYGDVGKVALNLDVEI